MCCWLVGLIDRVRLMGKLVRQIDCWHRLLSECVAMKRKCDFYLDIVVVVRLVLYQGYVDINRVI